MEMTEDEIARSYRQAANPGKQIRVLAELNLTNTSEIKKILERSGAMTKKSNKGESESNKEPENAVKRKYTRKPKETTESIKRVKAELCNSKEKQIGSKAVTDIKANEPAAGCSDGASGGSRIPTAVREVLEREIAAINEHIYALSGRLVEIEGFLE